MHAYAASSWGVLDINSGQENDLLWATGGVVKYLFRGKHALCREADAGRPSRQSDDLRKVCQFQLRCSLIAVADRIRPLPEIIGGHGSSLSLTVIHGKTCTFAACKRFQARRSGAADSTLCDKLGSHQREDCLAQRVKPARCRPRLARARAGNRSTVDIIH
jgi:hypothetical protein